nr:VCBS repeat-containing protein [Sulfitobacter donghicola]
MRCQLGHVRRGLKAACAGLALLAPVATDAQTAQPLVSATYAEPTTRYPHGVLGDTIEHGALELRFRGSNKRHVIRLPESRVFEDTAPRLVDVDGDGLPEVVVVESHQDKGARLAVYTSEGLLAATPYIGTRNRWLAPIAIADMDGDGAVELAYIDRPHLAKTLRIWRYVDGALVSLDSLGGLTNHRIGETDIAGGLRECGNGPEMIVASANWARLIAVTFDGSTLTAKDIGPHKGRASFAKALSCD